VSVSGILDFGDATHTALVNDVAVMAAYQLGDDPDPTATATDAIAGYHAVTELSAAELGLQPDGQAALNVVNELRERRVLISATGPHGNVLKIRPPLPFSYRQAGQFADALRESLASLARHS
jgi:Ser/Thr protein kinase RdoA (MazF antagonist)